MTRYRHRVCKCDGEAAAINIADFSFPFSPCYRGKRDYFIVKKHALSVYGSGLGFSSPNTVRIAR